MLITTEPVETYLETIGEPINKFELVPLAFSSFQGRRSSVLDGLRDLAEEQDCTAVTSVVTMQWHLKTGAIQYGCHGMATGLRKKKRGDATLEVSAESPSLWLAARNEPLSTYEIIPVYVQLSLNDYCRGDISATEILPDGSRHQRHKKESRYEDGAQMLELGIKTVKAVAVESKCMHVTSVRFVPVPSDDKWLLIYDVTATALRRKQAR